ncbi:uncharacterized protein BKCO1_35000120 [Diplodia corticola]|uniref:Uncharacterized protein n=1 Tax=Diplodia corticola TaxID=236234 RepID=A0A1J9QX18_9PEZI|nr:uncharacterized protein BKCO1_35000120 [Diplodia corticola]OJD32929.1 hypothetical protein BKCO1_35000120 [Diplodia corticola]
MAPKRAKGKGKAKGKAKAKAKESEPARTKGSKTADQLSMDEFSRVLNEAAKADKPAKRDESFEESLPAPFPKPGPKPVDLDDSKASSTDSSPSALIDKSETYSHWAATLLDSLATAQQSLSTARGTDKDNSQFWNAYLFTTATLLDPVNRLPRDLKHRLKSGLAGDICNKVMKKMSQIEKLWRPGGVLNKISLKEGASSERIKALLDVIDVFNREFFPMRPPYFENRETLHGPRLDVLRHEMVEWVVENDKRREGQTGARNFRETFKNMVMAPENAVEVLEGYMEPERRLAEEKGVGPEVDLLITQLGIVPSPLNPSQSDFPTNSTTAGHHLTGHIIAVEAVRRCIDDCIAHPEEPDLHGGMVPLPPTIELGEKGYYATRRPNEAYGDGLAPAKRVLFCHCDDCASARSSRLLDSEKATSGKEDANISIEQKRNEAGDVTGGGQEQGVSSGAPSQDPAWAKWVRLYKRPYEAPFKVFDADECKIEEEPEGDKARENLVENPDTKEETPKPEGDKARENLVENPDTKEEAPKKKGNRKRNRNRKKNKKGKKEEKVEEGEEEEEEGEKKGEEEVEEEGEEEDPGTENITGLPVSTAATARGLPADFFVAEDEEEPGEIGQYFKEDKQESREVRPQPGPQPGMQLQQNADEPLPEDLSALPKSEDLAANQHNNDTKPLDTGNPFPEDLSKLPGSEDLATSQHDSGAKPLNTTKPLETDDPLPKALPAGVESEGLAASQQGSDAKREPLKRELALVKYVPGLFQNLMTSTNRSESKPLDMRDPLLKRLPAVADPAAYQHDYTAESHETGGPPLEEAGLSHETIQERGFAEEGGGGGGKEKETSTGDWPPPPLPGAVHPPRPDALPAPTAHRPNHAGLLAGGAPWGRREDSDSSRRFERTREERIHDDAFARAQAERQEMDKMKAEWESRMEWANAQWRGRMEQAYDEWRTRMDWAKKEWEERMNGRSWAHHVEVASLEERLAESERRNAELERRNAELERRVVELERRVAESERRNAEWEQLVDRRCGAYETEIDGLKERIAELTAPGEGYKRRVGGWLSD